MEEEAFSAGSSNLAFPVLQGQDLARVAQTITQLFDPSTSSNPQLAKQLQHDLQGIQATPDAWGLIAGLASHQDPNVRFFGAHTAQVKISRDWNTLPEELHGPLLRLLLDCLGHAVSPSNPFSYQPANSLVVRKLFGSLASLLLRLPFHLFPSPLITVLSTLSHAAQSAASAPSSAPTSGFNTPTFSETSEDGARLSWKMRLWGLEWLSIVVEEIGRAGISEQKKLALKRHLEVDLPGVMEVIMASMRVHQAAHSVGGREEAMKEAEAACRCAESWIDYGLGGDELTAMLPALYDLLPLPAASSAIVEVLSESLFKFGKGTKILTEPLIAWTLSPAGQNLIGSAEGEPSDEVIAFAKLLATLVEHSSEWIVSKIKQQDVQAFLGLILRVSGWEGTGGVDENVSELLFPIYSLLQEAVMDSPSFAEPHETSENWGIAKGFFKELVAVIQRKVRWPGHGESSEGLGGLDKDDREAFDMWRRDAGEVVVGAYYILRDEMLYKFTVDLGNAIQNGQWQDIEAILHCIRFSSEGVPLGEEHSLPIVFGDQVLGTLAHRQQQGRGENRLRLTVISVIQAYEEWFKFHSEHLLPVLSYLVPSLTSTATISRAAADALKALCDICRTKLVQHIGAFAQLHDKIGDLGAEEQTKVIQAITSVIQALPPAEAIGPVEGILNPIVDRLSQAVVAVRSDPSAQETLVQTLSALTASFKGLSPSDDDIFDLSDEGPSSEEKAQAIHIARDDPRLIQLRGRIHEAVKGVVEVWNGDGEVADGISSLVKHSTLASENLISLSPLPLLSLVTTAAERSSSALWMSLASTLVLRINSPPSLLTQKRQRTEEEESQHQAQETERWNVVGDAASRLVVVAGNSISTKEAMAEHPDIVEGWFKFCSAMATRFPGVLLRLPTQLVEGYASLGLLGLGTHERFSLKSACDFFVALLAGTRFPSPLEPLADTVLKHFGPQLLRAVLLSAGSEGPRSVIPNLAELLAHFVQRIPGEEMMAWMDAVLAEQGFPDPRATPAAKTRLKEVVLKSRTAKKMREALHEFALVSRGLDNTTYGNATAVSK